MLVFSVFSVLGKKKMRVTNTGEIVSMVVLVIGERTDEKKKRRDEKRREE